MYLWSQLYVQLVKCIYMYKFLTFSVSEAHQCIKSFIYKTSLSKHVCFYQAFTVHFLIFPEKCNDSRSWDFFLILYVFAIITNQQASYLVSFYMIQSILNLQLFYDLLRHTYSASTWFTWQASFTMQPLPSWNLLQQGAMYNYEFIHWLISNIKHLQAYVSR